MKNKWNLWLQKQKQYETSYHTEKHALIHAKNVDTFGARWI